MTACAPSRTAAETAQVIPRSLNEPVGLAPSIFSQTCGADALGERRGAGTSGVEPSCEADDGIARRERQAVAVALDQARASRPAPHDVRSERLSMHADRARRGAHEVERARSARSAAKKRDSSDRVR